MSIAHEIKTVTIPQIMGFKSEGLRFAMVTVYDYTSAIIAEAAKIPILLVGDSLAMVIQGIDSTIPVTLEEMIYHLRIANRGRRFSLLIADMPYLTYHISIEDAIRNCGRCLKEGGANGVKIEGGRKRSELVRALINAEVPVMGHIGLTPQSINIFGSYGVQGKTIKKAMELIDDALALEDAGVFSIVLECVPSEVAGIITERVSVPTIGIGSGQHCDAQVLVFHDLLGLYDDISPKFVRRYGNFKSEMIIALKSYREDVESGRFPSEMESFHLKPEINDELMRKLSQNHAVV